jgi:hypothetical protein
MKKKFPVLTACIATVIKIVAQTIADVIRKYTLQRFFSEVTVEVLQSDNFLVVTLLYIRVNIVSKSFILLSINMIPYELLPHEYAYTLYLSCEYDLHIYDSMILNKNLYNLFDLIYSYKH